MLSLPVQHDTERLHASGVKFLLKNLKAPALEGFNNLLHSLGDDSRIRADYSHFVDVDVVSCLLRISIGTEYHRPSAV